MSRAAKGSLPCTLWSQDVLAMREALSSDLPIMRDNLYPMYQGVGLMIELMASRVKQERINMPDCSPPSGILCSPLSATKLGVVWILSVLETRNSWVDGARYARS